MYTDDNANDFDMEMAVTNPDQSLEEKQAEATETSNDLTEVTNLIKECATLCLDYTESHNKRESELITSEQNISSKILEEKFKLLCELNCPVSINVSKAMKIDTMQKQHLQKLNSLLQTEDECVLAYDTCCAEAVKATEVNSIKEKYDEYTEMPHAVLMDRIFEMKKQTESLKSASADMKAKYNLRLMENQKEFNSILKDTANLEKYELEAM
ncbi:uncharacterized protein LOC111595998 [Drosophila hydei]|uniref:Uncharacterized protein LOC111595998 n=1 Tax=Drosophila hydei TaxID=7224 RepID=A0A6J1LFI7_DROHY|nr:uncharacterized protein LOC111595998 [Drosophila hydei]